MTRWLRQRWGSWPSRLRMRPGVEELAARTLLSGLAAAGTFEAAESFNAGQVAVAVAVADVNGDGQPDLAVANSTSNNVSVLVGNGDGTFQSARNFDAGQSPSFVAVADVNGDGRPDLAVAHAGNYINAGNVSVLLGNGDGTFQSARNFAAGLYPFSVAVADVNGD